MPLFGLPNELLIQVGKGLDPRDLDRFIRTNRRLATLLTPVLDRLAVHYNVLPWASKHGHERLVSSLIDHGSDIEAMGDHGSDIEAMGDPGYSPLMLAAIHGHVAIVRVLLDKGANIMAEASVNCGLTALHCAVRANEEEVARILIERGADTQIYENGNGWLPQHFAATHRQSGITRLLLEKGVNINAQGRDYETALQIAAAGGNEETFELLMDRGADIASEIISDLVDPTLHKAVKGGSERIVRLLLEKGVDTTAQGSNGQTVLHIAATGNVDEKILQLLLEAGAEKCVNTCETTRGETPLLQAVKNDKRFHCEHPIQHTLLPEPSGLVDEDQVAVVAEANIRKIVQSLLDKGADVHLHNMLQETALHYAAGNGYTEIVQILLENGSDVAARDSGGRTALHWAAKGSSRYLNDEKSGHIVAMRLLLDNGADITSEDLGKKTVRDWASSENKLLCDLLEEMGQDVVELRKREYVTNTSDEDDNFCGMEWDLDDYDDEEVYDEDEDEDDEENSWDDGDFD